MKIPSDLVRLVRASLTISALTGAGVSQESGLRTFRDSTNASLSSQRQDNSSDSEKPLWTQYRPEDLATPEAFERDPNLVWEFYAMRRLKTGEVQPNPGHSALAEIGRRVMHFTLITQNVDGLHQRAGSKGVIELHGNITRVRCTHGCGVFTEWRDVPGGIPACPKCGANLRPDVVWFGEMLPQGELGKAIEAARNSQIFFSIGTSGQVQPAASLALMAKKSGAVVVEINAEETPLTPQVEYFLQGKSGVILPELVKQVWG